MCTGASSSIWAAWGSLSAFTIRYQSFHQTLNQMGQRFFDRAHENDVFPRQGQKQFGGRAGGDGFGHLWRHLAEHGIGPRNGEEDIVSAVRQVELTSRPEVA
jgi:hypothetical protein